jgi:hypothetical protein
VVFDCADCGINTNAIGEWYMVQDALWEQAWAGRQRQEKEFLCLGCLEGRIGRSLVASDFKDVPVNGPADPEISARMRNRLTNAGPIRS